MKLLPALKEALLSCFTNLHPSPQPTQPNQDSASRASPRAIMAVCDTSSPGQSPKKLNPVKRPPHEEDPDDVDVSDISNIPAYIEQKFWNAKWSYKRYAWSKMDIVDAMDLDPFNPPAELPAWDRTVDAGFDYSAFREEGSQIGARSLTLRKKFKLSHTLGEKWDDLAAKHQEYLKRYYKTRVHRLHKLPAMIRGLIYEKLLESVGVETNKPIILNPRSFTKNVWPRHHFLELREVLKPLQNALQVDFYMRTDILITLFMTHSFHVVFSPWIRPKWHPYATDWLNIYGCMIQDLTVEFDFTKLSYGPDPAAVGMARGSGAHGVLELVKKFTAGQARRREGCPTSMNSLTILGRRFYGNRPTVEEGGRHPFSTPPEPSPPPSPGRHTDRDHEAWNPAKEYEFAKPKGKVRASFGIEPEGFYDVDRHLYAPKAYRPIPYTTIEHEDAVFALSSMRGYANSVRVVGFSEEFTFELLNHLHSGNKKKRPNRPHEKNAHIKATHPSNLYPSLPGQSSYLDYGPPRGIKCTRTARVHSRSTTSASTGARLSVDSNRNSGESFGLRSLMDTSMSIDGGDSSRPTSRQLTLHALWDGRSRAGSSGIASSGSSRPGSGIASSGHSRPLSGISSSGNSRPGSGDVSWLSGRSRPGSRPLSGLSTELSASGSRPVSVDMSGMSVNEEQSTGEDQGHDDVAGVGSGSMVASATAETIRTSSTAGTIKVTDFQKKALDACVETEEEDVDDEEMEDA